VSDSDITAFELVAISGDPGAFIVYSNFHEDGSSRGSLG